MRFEKLEEVKSYTKNLSLGIIENVESLELKTYLNSKEFRKVYQCYSCHQPYTP